MGPGGVLESLAELAGRGVNEVVREADGHGEMSFISSKLTRYGIHILRATPYAIMVGIERNTSRDTRPITVVS